MAGSFTTVPKKLISSSVHNISTLSNKVNDLVYSTGQTIVLYVQSGELNISTEAITMGDTSGSITGPFSLELQGADDLYIGTKSTAVEVSILVYNT